MLTNNPFWQNENADPSGNLVLQRQLHLNALQNAYCTERCHNFFTSERNTVLLDPSGNIYCCGQFSSHDGDQTLVPFDFSGAPLQSGAGFDRVYRFGDETLAVGKVGCLLFGVLDPEKNGGAKKAPAFLDTGNDRPVKAVATLEAWYLLDEKGQIHVFEHGTGQKRPGSSLDLPVQDLFSNLWSVCGFGEDGKLLFLEAVQARKQTLAPDWLMEPETMRRVFLKQAVSNREAWAVLLMSDRFQKGRVLTWGSETHGGYLHPQTPSPATQLLLNELEKLHVTQLVATEDHFVAVDDQRQVMVLWGGPEKKFQVLNLYSPVRQISGIRGDLAVVLQESEQQDSTLVSLGDQSATALQGNYSPLLEGYLETTTKNLVNNGSAFAAPSPKEGSFGFGTRRVDTWGDRRYGGQLPSDVLTQFFVSDVQIILPVYRGFVTLTENGQKQAWGEPYTPETYPWIKSKGPAVELVVVSAGQNPRAPLSVLSVGSNNRGGDDLEFLQFETSDPDARYRALEEAMNQGLKTVPTNSVRVADLKKWRLRSEHFNFARFVTTTYLAQGRPSAFPSNGSSTNLLFQATGPPNLLLGNSAGVETLFDVTSLRPLFTAFGVHETPANGSNSSAVTVANTLSTDGLFARMQKTPHSAWTLVDHLKSVPVSSARAQDYLRLLENISQELEVVQKIGDGRAVQTRLTDNVGFFFFPDPANSKVDLKSQVQVLHNLLVPVLVQRNVSGSFVGSKSATDTANGATPIFSMTLGDVVNSLIEARAPDDLECFDTHLHWKVPTPAGLVQDTGTDRKLFHRVLYRFFAAVTQASLGHEEFSRFKNDLQGFYVRKVKRERVSSEAEPPLTRMELLRQLQKETERLQEDIWEEGTEDALAHLAWERHWHRSKDETEDSGRSDAASSLVRFVAVRILADRQPLEVLYVVTASLALVAIGCVLGSLQKSSEKSQIFAVASVVCLTFLLATFISTAVMIGQERHLDSDMDLVLISVHAVFLLVLLAVFVMGKRNQSS